MSRLFGTSDHRGLLAPLNEEPYGSSTDTAWDDQQGTVEQALQGASALTLDEPRHKEAKQVVASAEI